MTFDGLLPLIFCYTRRKKWCRQLKEALEKVREPAIRVDVNEVRKEPEGAYRARAF